MCATLNRAGQVQWRASIILGVELAVTFPEVLGQPHDVLMHGATGASSGLSSLFKICVPLTCKDKSTIIMKISAPTTNPPSLTRYLVNLKTRLENLDCNEDLPVVLNTALQCRRAPTAQGLRATQLVILGSLAASGQLPARSIVDDIATDWGTTGYDILSTLHEQDYLRLDDNGEIVVAYPFSVRPTRHRVELDNGATVFAMCAIDALGISSMTHSDVTIYSSTDSGDKIRVTFRQQQVSWDPQETVVILGTMSSTGAAADVCCQHVNFFVSRTAAEAWVQGHPGMDQTILDQERAVQIGAKIFGNLLQQESL